MSMVLLTMCMAESAAQQQAANDSATVKDNRRMSGIVADLLTRIPQRDVQIHLNTNKTVTTPWDGSYSISDTTFTSATVVKSGYLARNMNREEFSDTIFLLPTERLLGEVVVIGHNRSSGMSLSLNSVDAALIAAGQNQSFNPLGLLAYIAGKLGIIPDLKAKARRKKEKMKAIIDNY